MDYRSHKLAKLLYEATKNDIVLWKKDRAPKIIKYSCLGQYFTTTFKNKKLCIFQDRTYKIIIDILDDKEKWLIWNTISQTTVMEDLYTLVRNIYYNIDCEKILDELMDSC